MAYDTSVEGLIKESKRRVGAINPGISDRMELIIRRAKKRGINVVFTQGLRTYAEQAALYGQGRKFYVYGGKQYAKPSANRVTNAPPGYSIHNFGYALDYALIVDGTIVWNLTKDSNKNGRADWNEVAEIAKGLGFSWGGDWTSFKDMPHIDITQGLSTASFRAGKRPTLRALTAAEKAELKGTTVTTAKKEKDYSKDYYVVKHDRFAVLKAIGFYSKVGLAKADKVSTIKKGTKVDIISLVHGKDGIPRYKVKVDGKTGYVTTKRSHIKAYTLKANKGTTQTYSVKKGDTLTAIAKKFETTITKLKNLNGLASANVISIGQVLKIPADSNQ